MILRDKHHIIHIHLGFRQLEEVFTVKIND